VAPAPQAAVRLARSVAVEAVLVSYFAAMARYYHNDRGETNYDQGSLPEYVCMRHVLSSDLNCACRTPPEAIAAGCVRSARNAPWCP